MEKQFLSSKSRRPWLWLAAAILLCPGGSLSPRLLAQEFTVNSIERDASGRTTFLFPSATGHYFLLYAGVTPLNIVQPIAAALGVEGDGVLVDEAGTEDAGFYRILKVPNTVEMDSDGDVIDDLFELRHPGALDPIRPADAHLDFDQDGDSNLNEYLRGTDLTVANPVAPVVSLEAPAAHAVLPFGRPVSLTAFATDSSATIVAVSFFADDVLLGSVLAEPHTLAWMPTAPGSYRLASAGRSSAKARKSTTSCKSRTTSSSAGTASSARRSESPAAPPWRTTSCSAARRFREPPCASWVARRMSRWSCRPMVMFPWRFP